MTNILVKISGDLLEDKEALSFIQNMDDLEDSFIVVIVGGGTQINKRMKQVGMEIVFDAEGRRVHKNEQSNALAARVLYELRDKLEAKHVTWRFEVPILFTGPVRCHINADEYLHILAPSFHEAYCLTIEGRKKSFSKNIKIVEFKGENDASK